MVSQISKFLNPITGMDLAPWIFSKDVVLAVQYKVYLVKRVISLAVQLQHNLMN